MRKWNIDRMHNALTEKFEGRVKFALGIHEEHGGIEVWVHKDTPDHNAELVVNFINSHLEVIDGSNNEIMVFHPHIRFYKEFFDWNDSKAFCRDIKKFELKRF